MINENKVREPFIRVAKRADMPVGKLILLYAGSVLAALVIGGIFVSAVGANPFSFYIEVMTGCFKNKIYFMGLLRTIFPLVITSIGVSIAFKMKYWNIGAEGQFIIGAICATTAGLFLGEMLPHWLVMVLMALAGAIGGGLYGLITAVFKVKFGTNETLLTLMLNYVALYVVYILTKTQGFRVEGSRPDIKALPANAWIDTIGSVDITIIICVLIVALAFVYFKYTKQGYELAIVGESQNTARYAGMNVKKIILRTMFLSAAVIGIGGMLHVAGSATGHKLTAGVTGGVGWTAIIVAWLAKLNPIGVFIVAILMSILSKGCDVAQSTFGLPTAVSEILEGIILFSVLAFDFFVRFKIVIRKTDKTKKLELAVNNAYNDISANKNSEKEVDGNDNNN